VPHLSAGVCSDSKALSYIGLALAAAPPPVTEPPEQSGGFLFFAPIVPSIRPAMHRTQTAPFQPHCVRRAGPWRCRKALGRTRGQGPRKSDPETVSGHDFV